MPKYKKVKSLGNFCQQFIKLFVAWKDVISLEEAARQISDNDCMDEKMLKNPTSVIHIWRYVSL